MNKLSEQSIKIRVTREEMLYLMKYMGSNRLFGIDLKNSGKPNKGDRPLTDQKKIIDSLEMKGILLSDEKHGAALDPQISVMLDTVFFPERALLVLRDQRGDGRRFFHILAKGKTLTYHSFPNDKEHFIGLISKPGDIVPLIMGWFPFYRLPFSPAKFRIEKKTFDQVLALAISGKKDEALNALNPDDLDPEEKKHLIRALAGLRISGSIARYVFQNNEVNEGNSIAALTDGRTGWLISQDEPAKPDEAVLTVRRTGVDFAAAVRGMVEEFSGSKLANRQSDPAGKTIRFTLNLDEFAASLAAINKPDLSKKMYSSLSGDLSGEHYPDRMKKAQESLVASALCTVSDRGVPILSEDLAQAVFPIAGFDTTIQVAGSAGGAAIDLAVYAVRGRSFTAYRNYGEELQLLEYGKSKDLASYFESMFPDFGLEKGIEETSEPISYEAFSQALEKTSHSENAERILVSDGMAAPAAKLLAGDLSDIFLRAALRRWDAPVKQNNSETKMESARERVLILLTSPRRSWMFEFDGIGVKGKASATDRAGFLRSLATLLQ